LTSGRLRERLQNPFIPQDTTLEMVAVSKTIAASDFLSGDFTLTTPYNYP
jgi:hypothetical protein